MQTPVEKVCSMDEFAGDSRRMMDEVKETRQPLLLTVDGEAALVVQDAAAYQALLEAVDRAEAIAGIRRGLEEMERGEGIPLDEAFAMLRQKHGIPD